MKQSAARQHPKRNTPQTMISDNRNIQQLVSLMLAHGIADAVVCPGSRNAPISHTLSQTGGIRCHALTDERSAGFFAIGLALATKKTVAVCVTSGSALLNLAPAVSEAFYQQVPLVIISADRPAEWIGQMDGQTMPQPDALGKMVKTSVTLPAEGPDVYVNRLINEALLEATHRTLGPVHINVPIAEPFYEFHTDRLPEVRVIRRIEGLYPPQLRSLSELLDGTQRRMILLGQKPADRQIKPAFMGELDRCFATLTEHLSNSGEGSVALQITDSLIDKLSDADSEALRPDLLITIGGHIVSKKLKQWLRRNPPRQHWHVSPDGQLADLFGCLTTAVEAEPYRFLEALSYLMIPNDIGEDYGRQWNAHKAATEAIDKSKRDSQRQADDHPLTDEQSVVETLLSLLPSNAVLHLANSSSVRLAQRCQLSPTVTVCCNRGINGIEGCLSSAVGFATASPDRPNFVVIGDLAFFYDNNALWNTALPDNLHILLLNNAGGAIFNTLPLPDDSRSRDLIMARGQQETEKLCAHYGIIYQELTPSNEAKTTIDAFVKNKKSILLEWKETGKK